MALTEADTCRRFITPALFEAGRMSTCAWARRTCDAFNKDAIKVKCRPRVTQHGAATKAAVED